MLCNRKKTIYWKIQTRWFYQKSQLTWCTLKISHRSLDWWRNCNSLAWNKLGQNEKYNYDDTDENYDNTDHIHDDMEDNYDDTDDDLEGGVLIPEKDREEKFWYTVNTRSPANFLSCLSSKFLIC